MKILETFIKSQENLSYTRFIQDTSTNLLPKAVFSRSKADLGEATFLELLESGVFYFAPGLIGENLLRNTFSKLSPDSGMVRKNIVNSVESLKKNAEQAKKVIPVKAGIVLACTCIPSAEYALSFAKNLFTLKTFRKSNFNSIANLDKSGKEDIRQQKKVEEHAKSELKKAAAVSLGALGVGAALAAFGHKSKAALKFSEILLEPGKAVSGLLHKADIHSKGADEFLKKYLTLDFDKVIEKNKKTEQVVEKLGLSKGQLAVTCTTGLFGYSEAAKDRGKLDHKEVWTRVPLVVLYTIFGDAMFRHGFDRIFAKKGLFPDLIKKGPDGKMLPVPALKELDGIAHKAASVGNETFDAAKKRLVKEKAIITAIPYGFSLLFMGFTLSAVNRASTQYRYNHSEDCRKNFFETLGNRVNFKAFLNRSKINPVCA